MGNLINYIYEGIWLKVFYGKSRRQVTLKFEKKTGKIPEKKFKKNGKTLQNCRTNL